MLNNKRTNQNNTSAPKHQNTSCEHIVKVKPTSQSKKKTRLSFIMRFLKQEEKLERETLQQASYKL